MPTATHMTALQMVRDEIVSLHLESIPDDHIRMIKVEHERHTAEDIWAGGVLYPGVVVLPAGQETYGEGSNTQDDIIYPCGVIIFDADMEDAVTTPDQDDLESIYDLRLLWRQTIRDRFNKRRIDDLFCTVQFGQILDVARWLQYGQWSSQLIVQVQAREVVRG